MQESLKIQWKAYAKAEYFKIALYIKNYFGVEAKRKFVESVNSYKKALRQNPEMGKIDPLFADRARTYRSVIINGKSKMVYYVEDNVIQIAGFWDCRRDPIAQANQVK